MNSKKNSCRDNYMRKYSKCIIKSATRNCLHLNRLKGLDISVHKQNSLMTVSVRLCQKSVILKFGLFEKHTLFEKIFLMVLTITNLVCSSESLNFNMCMYVNILIIGHLWLNMTRILY